MINVLLLSMSLFQQLSLLGVLHLSLFVICTLSTSPISNGTQCTALSALLPAKVFYPNNSIYHQYRLISLWQRGSRHYAW